ncbi:CDP-alcohol phosphatidyltransferase family protein [Candidatus Falkowbacteria bacterium]|nr:CDP-alcohol phosphatidyltransferase family protein [Candidatus Falkowbacteria bacterium]
MTQEFEAPVVAAEVKKRDHIWQHLVECLPEKLTPNHLSGFRLFLAIPIIVLIIVHYNKTAGGLFLFAAILDWLDGSMARIRNQITKFGAYLDPTADKTVNFAAFFGFIYTIRSDYYLHLVIPIIIIDLLLFFIATFKYALIRWPNHMRYFQHKMEIMTSGANKFGKIKMVLQVIVISFLLIFDPTTSFTVHKKFGFLPDHLTLLDFSFPLLVACIIFGLLSIRGHLKAIKILP